MKSLLNTKNSDESDHLFAGDLASAAAGDEHAVKRLVAEFEPGLQDFAKRRGASDPEGVVNLTLSAGIGSLHSFRGRDRRAFRAYLYQILRRRIVDEHRRSYTQPRTVLGLDGELITDLVDEKASSFDDRVADRELVQEILDQLTEEQREVLEMRVLTGLSIRETAIMTGRSEMAVKSMQRRALLSLRSVVIALAVAALGFFGVRAIMSLGAEVVVVENGPASSGEGGSGDGGLQNPPADEHDAEGAVDVLEAQVPEARPASTASIETDEAGSGDDGESETVSAGDSTGTTISRSATDTAPAGSGSGANSESTSAEGPNQNTDQERSPEQGSSSLVGYGAPCSVITDGTPAKGELGFVTFHFGGPYELFKGTSVDIVGLSKSSVLLQAKPNPDRVWNGTKLPFVISGNMLVNGDFRVQSLLADGHVKTDCDIAEDRYPQPCKVRTDGTPEVGETVSVTYRPAGLFWVLEGRSTYVVDAGGETAFRNGTTATLKQGAVRSFIIDESMFSDDRFEVRTAFADGKATTACQIL